MYREICDFYRKITAKFDIFTAKLYISAYRGTANIGDSYRDNHVSLSVNRPY